MFHLYKNILVLHKRDHALARELAGKVCDWLKERGVQTRTFEGWGIFSTENIDCVVVLGGDGTILGVARHLAGTGIPIFGINFGKVGFLTTASRTDWEDRLENALSGKIPLRECLSLRWSLHRKGELVAEGVAGNDLVLSRESLARLVSAHVRINDADMGIMRSDGIILSTPLGSSGYNLSAGGPLLYVGLNAICLAPICPFITGISPLVFPGDTGFEFRISHASADCFITIDGQEGQKLEKGDLVRVRGWEKSICFIAGDNQFFARMRMRGFTLESS